MVQGVIRECNLQTHEPGRVSRLPSQRKDDCTSHQLSTMHESSALAAEAYGPSQLCSFSPMHIGAVTGCFLATFFFDRGPDMRQNGETLCVQVEVLGKL